jgi:hypothetical protein
MNEMEKSDDFIVPKKSGNSSNDQQIAGAARGADGGKEVGQGELEAGHPHRTLGRKYGGQNGLRRVGAKARRDSEKRSKDKQRFTNLLSHLRVDLFHEVYQRLKKRAAAGVDGQSWADYGENLEERLEDLQDRVHRGGYHPPPVRRTYIPKADGRQRPLGIPTIEDKIVQGAVQALQALRQFRDRILRKWHWVLQRRSQRARLSRRQRNHLDRVFPLPKPRINRRNRQLRLVPLT